MKREQRSETVWRHPVLFSQMPDCAAPADWSNIASLRVRRAKRLDDGSPSSFWEVQAIDAQGSLVHVLTAIHGLEGAEEVGLELRKCTGLPLELVYWETRYEAIDKQRRAA